MSKFVVAVSSIALFFFGCSKTQDSQRASVASAPANATTAAGAGSVAMGPVQSAAGVHFAAPAAWQLGPPRPMRAATYTIPPAAGDAEGGECGVFFFGSGQGGSVDANLSRWLAQFTQPDGKPITDFARRERRDAGGIPVTVVDVSGTYLFSPTPMSQEKTPKPGYRMLGAIVEAPQGSLFFKLTGPSATLAASAGGFDAMLQSLSRS